MLHLMPTRIATEERHAATWIATTEDGLKRISVVGPIHLDIYAVEGLGRSPEAHRTSVGGIVHATVTSGQRYTS